MLQLFGNQRRKSIDGNAGYLFDLNDIQLEDKSWEGGHVWRVNFKRNVL